jgi:hypothetical protein
MSRTDGLDVGHKISEYNVEDLEDYYSFII